MSAAGITIENLALDLGGFRLGDINLGVEPGEIVVILGPNGAGKSVLLETIAGFYRPDAGRIAIGGRDVTRLPPERRNLGFMVQNFGLFPHLTVAGNVALALRARGGRSGSAADPIPSDLPGLLGFFGVTHLAERRPAQLSAGEKQRVALARALASRPDLFLFDEPFSALDTRTREALRAELETFLRRTRIPAIFVTHDHAEAFALADRIVLMRAGAVVQAGAPADILRRPAGKFAAAFMGIENILAARLLEKRGGKAVYAVAGKRLAADADDGAPETAWLCIRADDVMVRAGPGRPRGLNHMPARITALRPAGALARLTLDCGFALEACVMARTARAKGLKPGAKVAVAIAASDIHPITREKPARKP